MNSRRFTRSPRRRGRVASEALSKEFGGKQPKRHDPRRSGGIYHSSIEESSLPVRGSAAKIRCYLLQTKQS
jgi:hypothetical protein